MRRQADLKQRLTRITADMELFRFYPRPPGDV
jgi:hypothetical protein